MKTRDIDAAQIFETKRASNVRPTHRLAIDEKDTNNHPGRFSV